MNMDNLKNKNIHFVECENWHDAYGYEKSQMKEDTINYIEQLQQKNQKLQERIEYLERSNDRRESTILEQRHEICDLGDNWDKLREIIRKKQDYYRYVKDNRYRKFLSELLNKMQELQGGDNNGKSNK